MKLIIKAVFRFRIWWEKKIKGNGKVRGFNNSDLALKLDIKSWLKIRIKFRRNLSLNSLFFLKSKSLNLRIRSGDGYLTELKAPFLVDILLL